MRVFITRVLLLTLLQFTLPGWSRPALALRLKCSDFPVVFEFDAPMEVPCLCASVQAAMTFLESLGLETREGITIRLVERFSPQRSQTMLGCYDPDSGEVDLLTYSAAVKLARKSLSAEDFVLSEELWCSYAAHELAHAVSAQSMSTNTEARTAGEYISAVTQMSVLSPPTRERILSRYAHISAYKSMAEMSIVYYLFAPNEFAVKCYRHFISLQEPREFVQCILQEENCSLTGY